MRSDFQIQNPQTVVAKAQATIRGVSFDSTVTIDENGLVRLHSNVSNGNSFGKRKALVRANVVDGSVNGNKIVLTLKPSPVNLYGKMISMFSGKRSSDVIVDERHLSFDDIADQVPRDYEQDPLVKNIDAEISRLGKDIRRARILGDTLTVDNLSKQLQDLKKKRLDEIYSLERKKKLSTVSLDIFHSINGQ